MMRDSGSVKLYWSLACGSGRWRCRRTPAWLAAGALGFGFPCVLFGFVLGLFGRLALLQPVLQDLLGLG